MSITSDASITINAPADKVWQAITTPAIVKQWFFGTTVESSWNVGEAILFRGEWNRQAYEDKGVIKRIEHGKLLEYTHLSSRTSQADEPENYELVRFDLAEVNGQTTMHIHEENLASFEARDKSIELWNVVLANLKKTVEG